MSETRAYRRGKPLFIDKMPNNFRHVGLIHLMLPNAKIIDVRREPMACCFSNLKQLFASGQEFTYSVERYRPLLPDLSRADAALGRGASRPGTASSVRGRRGGSRGQACGACCEFCGLEFEPACVEFYNTERSIRTRKLRAGPPADFPHRLFRSGVTTSPGSAL